MAADVEVEASAVLQEHVRRPAPAHHPAKEVAGHLVRAEPPLPAKGAGLAIRSGTGSHWGLEMGWNLAIRLEMGWGWGMPRGWYFAMRLLKDCR